MRKKVIIGIVGIVVALALLTPNAPKESTGRVTGDSTTVTQEVATTNSGITPKKEVAPPQVCDVLRGAQSYIKDFESRVVATEGEDYLKTEECIAFENAFWESFWEEHNDCPICKENGYYESN